jgi:hypothetical protein
MTSMEKIEKEGTGGRGGRECGSREQVEEIPLHINHHCTCHKAEVQKTASITPIYVCFCIYISDQLLTHALQHIHLSDVLQEACSPIHPV